jgi:hypothetical protein
MTQTDDSPRAAGATRVTPQSWAAVRAAFERSADRFVHLVLSLPDPSVRATEQWSAAETAAHVTGTALNYAAAMTGTDFPIPEVRPLMPVTTVDTIHTGLNVRQLESFQERDLDKLADRLGEAAATMLKATETFPPDFVFPWMGGARLPLAGVMAHMMNEMQVHGRDIARAARLPWRIPDRDAALFFDLFIVELIRHGYGVLLDDDRPVRPGRISVRFQSAHNAPVILDLVDGVLAVRAGDGGAVDVHVRFRPTAMNLMLWHRTSRTRTALGGSVVVWGRRPWLLVPFLRTLRMP